jgi:hypothetical protein
MHPNRTTGEGARKTHAADEDTAAAGSGARRGTPRVSADSFLALLARLEGGAAAGTGEDEAAGESPDAAGEAPRSGSTQAAVSEETTEPSTQAPASVAAESPQDPAMQAPADMAPRTGEAAAQAENALSAAASGTGSSLQAGEDLPAQAMDQPGGAPVAATPQEPSSPRPVVPDTDGLKAADDEFTGERATAAPPGTETAGEGLPAAGENAFGFPPHEAREASAAVSAPAAGHHAPTGEEITTGHEAGDHDPAKAGPQAQTAVTEGAMAEAQESATAPTAGDAPAGEMPGGTGSTVSELDVAYASAMMRGEAASQALAPAQTLAQTETEMQAAPAPFPSPSSAGMQAGLAQAEAPAAAAAFPPGAGAEAAMGPGGSAPQGMAGEMPATQAAPAFGRRADGPATGAVVADVAGGAPSALSADGSYRPAPATTDPGAGMVTQPQPVADNPAGVTGVSSPTLSGEAAGMPTAMSPPSPVAGAGSGMSGAFPAGGEAAGSVSPGSTFAPAAMATPPTGNAPASAQGAAGGFPAGSGMPAGMFAGADTDTALTGTPENLSGQAQAPGASAAGTAFPSDGAFAGAESVSATPHAPFGNGGFAAQVSPPPAAGASMAPPVSQPQATAQATAMPEGGAGSAPLFGPAAADAASATSVPPPMMPASPPGMQGMTAEGMPAQASMAVQAPVAPAGTSATVQPPVPAASAAPAEESAADVIIERLLAIMAMPDSQAQPSERALATDALILQLPEASAEAMRMVVRRFCLMERPPEALTSAVLSLVHGEALREVLENARFSTWRLLELARTCDDETRVMLARRRHLPTVVSEALIETGHPGILLELVRNTHANIDEHGFHALVDLAAEHPAMQAPLATRSDLPPAAGFRLFRHVPPRLRRHLISRFLSDSRLLDQVFSLILRDPPPASAEQISRIESMIDSIAAGDAETAARLLSRLLELHEDTARWIVSDRWGEPLVVVLKVLGYSRSTFPQAMGRITASPAGPVEQGRDPGELQALFDSLSFNKARLLLLYWDWEARGTGPYGLLREGRPGAAQVAAADAASACHDDAEMAGEDRNAATEAAERTEDAGKEDAGVAPRDEDRGNAGHDPEASQASSTEKAAGAAEPAHEEMAGEESSAISAGMADLSAQAPLGERPEEMQAET